MAFKGNQFDREQISPMSDSRLFHYLGGGANRVLPGVGNGMDVTTNGLVATINTGACIIYGRMIEVISPHTVDIPANAEGYICATIDLTQANTSEGDVGTDQYVVTNNQIRFEHVSSLTLDDINNGGSLFTLNLGRVTSSASVASFTKDIIAYATAGTPNSIYRGKYLGDHVTDEQYLNISNGSFHDLFIGDYWAINGMNYRIAAFDYWLHAGDTDLTTHHAVIVPDEALYTAQMNTTNVTTGGYTGSRMYTTNLNSAKTTIKAAFPNHVLKHREYLCNAVTSGASSGFAAFDSEIDLMNEIMVYGSRVWNGGQHNIGTSKTQLPLFFFRPDLLNIRVAWWLRDVTAATNFAFVNSFGFANSYHASYTIGVRPAFAIS